MESFGWMDDDDDDVFCRMVDRRKALSFISSRDQCRRFSQLQISIIPRTEFEPGQNLTS